MRVPRVGNSYPRRMMAAALWLQFRRPVRHALSVVGLVGLIVLLLNPDAHGQDAHAYWSFDPADPYALSHGTVTAQDAFLYSPAVALLFVPFHALPWTVFITGWTLLLAGAAIWLGRSWGLALLALYPVLLEVGYGNISLLLAVAIVVGFRRPGAWAVVLLTKVTPGIGLFWFVLRREWAALAEVLVVVAAAVVISALIVPDLWPQWFRLLAESSTLPDPGAFGMVPRWAPLRTRLRVGGLGRPDGPALARADRRRHRDAGLVALRADHARGDPTVAGAQRRGGAKVGSADAAKRGPRRCPPPDLLPRPRGRKLVRAVSELASDGSVALAAMTCGMGRSLPGGSPEWRPRSALLPAIGVALASLAASTALSRFPRQSVEYLGYAVILAALYLLLVRILAEPFPPRSDGRRGRRPVRGLSSRSSGSPSRTGWDVGPRRPSDRAAASTRLREPQLWQPGSRAGDHWSCCWPPCSASRIWDPASDASPGVLACSGAGVRDHRERLACRLAGGQDRGSS